MTDTENQPQTPRPFGDRHGPTPEGMEIAEARDAGPAVGRMLGHLAKKLNTERAAHQEHRQQLAAALGLIDPRAWADMIDQVSVIRAAASERADLLTEARDALEAAGQGGAHGDDWPAVAPAIRTLGAERDGLAEARQDAEQRNADNWARAEKAEAALARVREAANQLADGTEAGFRAALAIRAALDDDQPAETQRVCSGRDGGHCFNHGSEPDTCCGCGAEPPTPAAEVREQAAELQPLLIPEAAARDLYAALGRLLGEQR